MHLDLHLKSVQNIWAHCTHSKILLPSFQAEQNLLYQLPRPLLRQLPLQQRLSSGSHALDSRVEAMIISSFDDAGRIHVRAGIFYSSIIAGCSCADDPTPVDEHAEYCEVILVIDKATGETVVTLPE